MLPRSFTMWIDFLCSVISLHSFLIMSYLECPGRRRWIKCILIIIIMHQSEDRCILNNRFPSSTFQSGYKATVPVAFSFFFEVKDMLLKGTRKNTYSQCTTCWFHQSSEQALWEAQGASLAETQQFFSFMWYFNTDIYPPSIKTDHFCDLLTARLISHSPWPDCEED